MAKTEEPQPQAWLPWAFGAAAAALLVLFAIAAQHLLTAHGPVCSATFPARRSEYPSWYFVFAGMGAFVAGSLTSQYQIRHGKRSQDELGKGQWKSPTAIVTVNVGVGLFLLLVTILMGIEAWTLGHGVWPITYYVRCANDAGPVISLIGMASLSFIIGRWMWVFKDSGKN
jgi:hypothetical protein